MKKVTQKSNLRDNLGLWTTKQAWQVPQVSKLFFVNFLFILLLFICVELSGMHSHITVVVIFFVFVFV